MKHGIGPLPDFSSKITAAANQIGKARIDRENALHGLASVLYERLMDQIKDFEKTLKPNEEIGAYLSSFGQQVVIHVEGVGYHNPHLIVFYGFSNGERVQLVQHTTQLNVLFVAVKVTEDRPARRIGFITEEQVEPPTPDPEQ